MEVSMAEKSHFKKSKQSFQCLLPEKLLLADRRAGGFFVAFRSELAVIQYESRAGLQILCEGFTVRDGLRIYSCCKVPSYINAQSSLTLQRQVSNLLQLLL